MLTCKFMYTLPETNIAPENGRLEDIGRLLSFWDGLFSGPMLVSGRVHVMHAIETHVQSPHATRLRRTKLAAIAVSCCTDPSTNPP